MNFKDLKIGTKIMTGFGAVALITLIVGLIGYIGLNSVAKSFHNVADVRMPSIESLQEIELGFENLRAAQRTLLNPHLKSDDKALQFKNISEARARYTKALAIYEPLEKTQEEAAIWKEFRQKLGEWRDANNEFENILNELNKVDIHYPMQFLKDLQTIKSAHYQLQVKVSNTIRNGQTFEGGDDHISCQFGKWLPTMTSKNPNITNAISNLTESHRKFHESVATIKRLVNNGNRNQAWTVYETITLPSANIVFENFETIVKEVEHANELFETAEALNLNKSRLLQEEVYVLLNKVIQINEHESAMAVEIGDQAVSTSDAMVIGGIIIGLVVALALGIMITRMISAPLIKGVGFAQTVAEGDLTAELDNEIVDRKDEVGQLAGAMQNMVNKLKEVIGSVMLGSDNIAAASMQMSSGSQQVSQGASEQASSAEEVSSSMEEMAANIQQNTDNAQEADKISQKVQDGVQKVGAAAGESLTSIRNISEKIGIINDIAFQTNILALNAAVEAARAGEQGRGFAVVAAEVRKLAERSKLAADEIVALSTKSVNVTETASGLMNNLIPEIERTAKLVQEIAAASMEQSSGADQVNTAIQQLNQVTQQNAAASEEMATSAEELSSQADQLKEIIGYFRIDNRRINSFQTQNHYTPKKSSQPQVQTIHNGNGSTTSKGVTLKMSDGMPASRKIADKAFVTSPNNNDGDFENY